MMKSRFDDEEVVTALAEPRRPSTSEQVFFFVSELTFMKLTFFFFNISKETGPNPTLVNWRRRF